MGKTYPASAALSAFNRHYLAGLAVFASVIGAAIAFLSTTSSSYETSARLIVQDNRASVSDLGQRLTTAEPPRDVNPIATQAELVESQRVLQRALKSLRQDGGISSEELPSISEVREGVRVKIVPATSILDLTYEYSNPEIAAQILNAIAESMVIENTQIIRSEASSVREFLEKQIPLLQADLEKDEINERNYRRDKGLVSAEIQVESLVSSLAALEQEERKLLAQLQEVGTRNNLLQQVTAADAPENAYIDIRVGQDEELKKLQNELTTLEVEIADNRSRLGDLHPDLLAMIDEREELNTLYAQRLASLTSQENSASSENAASNEHSQELLSQYITGDIERQALSEKLKIIQSEIARVRTQVTQIPVLQQPLTSLVREREEAELTLKQLQSKLQEARIAEAQQAGSIRIVGYAEVPTSPVSPKATVVLLMAIAVGTVLAVGIILLLEVADTTLRTPTETENLLKIPVLGVLPKIPTKLKLEQFLDNSTFVEPYRALLKNLESRSIPQQSLLKQENSVITANINNNSSSPGKPSQYTSRQARVIVISSTIAEEGKSQVSLFIAAVSAMLSRRTLLVDIDSHSPVQHQLLNQPNQPGLTDVTSGRSSFAQAVQVTEVKGLSLLAHGQMLNRPSTLTESNSIERLLNDVRADYDLIILDAPLISTCADAATLSQSADGLVLVTRPKFIPGHLVAQAVLDLQQSGVSIIGIVLNNTAGSKRKPFLKSKTAVIR